MDQIQMLTLFGTFCTIFTTVLKKIFLKIVGRSHGRPLEGFVVTVNGRAPGKNLDIIIWVSLSICDMEPGQGSR